MPTMPRVLHPSSHVPWHRHRFSDGARAFTLLLALGVSMVWFVALSEQARLTRAEMRDMTARLGRFEARAAAFERELLGPR